jgi:hypothetical protein
VITPSNKPLQALFILVCRQPCTGHIVKVKYARLPPPNRALWTRAGVRLVLKGACKPLSVLSNRSLHRRNGNWKIASRDRRPKPAPHGPKYRKLATRDWGTPA